MDANNGRLVDGRSERRFGVRLPAIVTVLSGEDVRVTAHIRNASGRGLALEMPTPVSPGAALKVEMEDALLLGEAVYCRSESGKYVVGLQLDQVLNGLAELSQRLREFSEEPAVRPSN
jgi:hypothetical protein